MYKYGIISFTEESKKIIDKAQNDMSIVVIAENDYETWGIEYKGIKVCSFDMLINMYKNKKIDRILIPSIKNGNVLHTMYVALLENDIKDDTIYYVSHELTYENKPIFENDLINFIDRKELDRLEIHITDHCNLKCANCSMLSGLVKSNKNANFSITQRALINLHKYYDQIYQIDLIGGEPTLNPDLMKYCSLLRELYPKSKIFIVTNGTTIINMTLDKLYLLREKDITFAITYYPTFDKNILSCIEFLNQNSVHYEILPKRVNFLKLYDLEGKQIYQDVYRRCKKKLLVLAIRENIFASCYVPFAICNAKERFNLDYTDEVFVDLLENNLSRRKIMSILTQPLKCCKFCHDDKEEWRQGI